MELYKSPVPFGTGVDIPEKTGLQGCISCLFSFRNKIPDVHLYSLNYLLIPIKSPNVPKYKEKGSKAHTTLCLLFQQLDQSLTRLLPATLRELLYK